MILKAIYDFNNLRNRKQEFNIQSDCCKEGINYA